MNYKPLILSYYLPQYHPFPENDEWWGKGFTEWTNVVRARKLFPGHYQPHIPKDLGFYDLRVPETRLEQAHLAKQAGIDGFCYWHYWFNGHKMMERPFEEVVNSESPNFPFCLNWANHSWYAKLWDKSKPDKLLIEQTYGGIEEYIEHFNYLLDAFKDSRYIKIDGKLLFGIYSPNTFPDLQLFMSTWNKLACENGLEGFHFFTHCFSNEQAFLYQKQGFDTVLVDYAFKREDLARWGALVLSSTRLFPQIVSYQNYVNTFLNNYSDIKGFAPEVIPNWDHSPRSGRRGMVMVNSTPEKFGQFMSLLFSKINRFSHKPKFIMIKSWNEWGEGNYMEPDMKFGTGFLDALHNAIEENF